MKKDFLSQEHQGNVSQKMHHSTITMALTILILGIIILPWGDYCSPAFIPLILSIVVSFFTLISAVLSLRKQVKKEMVKQSGTYHRDSSSKTSL